MSWPTTAESTARRSPTRRPPAAIGSASTRASSASRRPRTTDTASGLDVDLKVPQQQSPSTPSPSEIRGTTVTLPEGFSINPNAADGKGACTDAEASRHPAQAECPENSKVGTLTVESAALPGPLPGYIYLRDAGARRSLPVFLVADGFGLHVKLPRLGQSRPGDRAAGHELPGPAPVPLLRLQHALLRIRARPAGDAGALRHLLGGLDLHPWDSALPDQSSRPVLHASFGPGRQALPGRHRPFEPDLRGRGDRQDLGGAPTFILQLTREDGDQNLTGAERQDAARLLGDAEGHPLLPGGGDRPAAAAPSTRGSRSWPPPPARQRARSAPRSPEPERAPTPSTSTARSTSPAPTRAPRSASWSSIPAVSGPYDLGNVAVRAALNVDPVTAQVTAVSDPLPQILEGVPLRTRFVRVNLDRPDFALNPTNCDPFAVDATIAGDEGASAGRSTHFQVANCASLPFGPKLGIKLKGGTKRTSHPELRAVLRANQGDANLSSTSVALPRSIFLDNSHLRNICTRVDFAADVCPKASIYGNATVYTPILDKPLRGPVYLRSSSNPLPDLVLDLHGQVDVEATARIDSPRTGDSARPSASSPISRSQRSFSTCRAGTRVCFRSAATTSVLRRAGPRCGWSAERDAAR